MSDATKLTAMTQIEGAAEGIDAMATITKILKDLGLDPCVAINGLVVVCCMIFMVFYMKHMEKMEEIRIKQFKQLKRNK